MTWESLWHPNVLPSLGASMAGGHLMMVSERMTNGDINEFIRRRLDVNRYKLVSSPVNFPEHQSCYQPCPLLGQLADATKGLIYLHNREMAHGGLKGVSLYDLGPTASDELPL